MNKSMRWLYWGIIVIFLVSCGPKEPTSLVPLIQQQKAATVQPSGQFERVDCTLQSFDPTARMECGVLTVPEDRTHPEGNKTKLPVVIFKTSAEKPQPDPIVLLISSPSPVMGYANGLAYYLRNLSANRDFIVMEQRGVGQAEPNLECPELTNLFNKNLDKDPRSPDLISESLDLQRLCRESAEKSGVNLAAYTSETTAADFEDLRLTLKYDQWNLFGMGYGSRLALIMMQNYPQGIRSVILDSPIPPQANYFASGAVQAEQTLNLVFQRCAEDDGCHQAYPDLKSVFYADVAQMNDHPVTLKVTDSQSGRSLDMWADGDTLISVVLMAVDFSFQPMLPLVPRMLYQVKDGRYDDLTSLLPTLMNNAPISVGMQNLVFCQEDLNQTTLEKIQEANSKADSSLANYFDNQARDTSESCDIWKIDPASVIPGTALVKTPVSSDVPALVFSGDFSWNTPTSWAEDTAKSLGRGLSIEFAGAGGAVSFSDTWRSCAQSIGNAFFNDPQAALDTSCAKDKKSTLWITLQEPGK